MEHEGKWGYICATGWNRANSFVLCGQLGFPYTEAANEVPVEDAEPVFWLDEVECKGWESSIVSCHHAGWGPHRCESSAPLRIKCGRRKITKVSKYVGMEITS